MRWRAANEKTFASLPVGSKLRAKALSEASDPEDPEEARYKEYLRRCRAEAMASVSVGPQYVSGYTRQGVRKLYPMCEYANILWVPFEVQQDWLHAARFALNEVAPTYAQTATDRRWLKLASKRLAFIEAGDREGFEAFARLRQCAPCYISAPGTQCPSCRKKMRPAKKAAPP